MREDLIASAVTFLRDPNVVSAPHDKKVAFLKAKHLTDDEINASIARASEPLAVTPSSAPPALPSYPPPAGYPAYQTQLAPELPRRDWRDYFIMATVTTGATYGLYMLAKHYVMPLISPPPPPQLQQDKEAIDAQFAEAFAKLDELSTSTTALKAAEEERSARVNTAMDEVETAIAALKESAKKREEENRRLAEEIKGLRTLIPKSLEGHKEAQQQSLQELQAELKSLKSLLVNRTSAAAARPAYMGAQASSPAVPTGNSTDPAHAAPQVNGTPRPILPFGGIPGGGKPAIPAWQLAAQAKSASVESESASAGGA